MDPRPDDMTIAREVRKEHADGGRCNECRDGGPCPRLAAWAAWNYVLEARRQR